MADSGPAPSFVSGRWPELAGWTYESTSVAGFSLIPGTMVTVSFDRSGFIQGRAGCNYLGSAATISVGRLSAGPMSVTAMSCAARPAAQDAWLAQFLSSRPTVAVRGALLVISAGSTVISLKRTGVGATAPGAATQSAGQHPDSATPTSNSK